MNIFRIYLKIVGLFNNINDQILVVFISEAAQNAKRDITFFHEQMYSSRRQVSLHHTHKFCIV